MSTGAEETVTFAVAVERVRDGDTFTASMTETVFSFLIGFKGGTESKTSRGEGVRFLGAWCPEKSDPGGPEATAYTDVWLTKHDHPKQHAWSKSLVANCSTDDLRDNFGRFLALVRCTTCGAVLNEDLVTSGHATRERLIAARAEDPMDFARHERALNALRAKLGGGKRFGADTLLRMMAGQTSLSLALDEQPASK